MLLRSRAERPAVLALVLEYRQVVDAGDTHSHQAVLVELPVLVPIAAKPMPAVVVPLVSESDRDTVAGECPQLLDQAIVELAVPFAYQEGLDGLAAAEELRAVAPAAVGRIGERHTLGIPGVPGVFGQAHFLRRGLGIERRERGSIHARLELTAGTRS